MLEPPPLQQIDRTFVRFQGRRLIYFSGCDYFRLASHPRVLAAAELGLRRYGLNVAASRLTTGNHQVYQELERKLGQFFGAEGALLVANGYSANLIAAQALCGQFSHALIDEASHTSLVDATRFLGCPVLQFCHRDADHLATAVRRCGPDARLILLTDGMFAHNGAAAPLRTYRKMLPKDAWMLVDDAHGAGVLGRTGRGAPEHAGVSRQNLIQTLTLSKAFGTYGGVILGGKTLRQRVLDRSHMFIGSTPPPLPLAQAALQAVALLAEDAGRRARLTDNAAYVKDALNLAGLPLGAHPGPIVSLVAKNRTAGRDLKANLLEAGIFPPFLIYPGGPPGGFFRFVISSEHTQKQLSRLVKVLQPALGSFAPR